LRAAAVTSQPTDLRFERPKWLPSYIPELQGLRGLAVLGVVFYHCHPRLEGTWIHYGSLWGWAGVNLFFVLSGFLITSILLEARTELHYFRNFYARRALRIWPVYVLVLVICYANAPWFIGPSVWAAVKTAPWLAYILFLQNLFHLAMPPAIGQTWSLAIEEQYYFLWAPLVRILHRPWMLGLVLSTAFVSSPLLRLAHLKWVTPTHSLIHLDGIALGSTLAVALYTMRLSRRMWLLIGLTGLIVGVIAAATIAGGTAFLDTALAFAFGGAVLAAIASTGATDPLNAVLRRGPLAFYGRISYGLYMIHIMVFIYFGWFDKKMDTYGTAGNLAIVAVRLGASTCFATALWYGIESQVLKLKRRF
jgi:peptidoglycan/LPS O-acetylase OafA/YrhL